MDNIMFITMCFCWHYLVALCITAINFSLVYWYVKTNAVKFLSLTRLEVSVVHSYYLVTANFMLNSVRGTLHL